MARVTPRTEERAGFTDKVRLRLVEGDLDGIDQKNDALEKKLDVMIRLLMGVLVSTTTASIFLAIQRI